ncbi:uncharacterized protein LOC120354850 [Nilaparvata lugens]|uniref:uncharacterized protein LOC120354850 n=1 Tax=Nilaparvata lugens TaxID=108931 RepID=UPI00193E688C|nr:uncharacterized protein LOC120354850 [Nilaparvata lugens]
MERSYIRQAAHLYINSPSSFKTHKQEPSFIAYKAATTSPPPTTARPTTTSTTTTQAPPPSNGAPRNGPTHGHRPFRTRGGGRPAGAYRRRRPLYYYYYYDDDDDGPDDGHYDFYDEPVERERQQPRAKGNRKQPNQAVHVCGKLIYD